MAMNDDTEGFLDARNSNESDREESLNEPSFQADNEWEIERLMAFSCTYIYTLSC
jgi:hypothetical protein